MKELNKRKLDFETTFEYIKDNLDQTNALSSELLSLLNFKNGYFFTLLPDHANVQAAHNFKSGWILPRQKSAVKKLITYCRVSSARQKNDLIAQRRAVEAFCLAGGKEIHEKLEDIGSGLNDKRKNFIKLMEMVEQGAVSSIVVAHKDRLVRFGFEWFEKFCRDHGVKITVMNADS